MKKLLGMFALVLVLAGAGCAGGGSVPDSSSDVQTFEAPSDWGTTNDTINGFTWNYPPEYTVDLNFDTRCNEVKRRSDGEILIEVCPVNGSLEFTQVADDVPEFDQIRGTVKPL